MTIAYQRHYHGRDIFIIEEYAEKFTNDILMELEQFKIDWTLDRI